jgi:hypothetical protein
VTRTDKGEDVEKEIPFMKGPQAPSQRRQSFSRLAWRSKSIGRRGKTRSKPPITEAMILRESWTRGAAKFELLRQQDQIGEAGQPLRRSPLNVKLLCGGSQSHVKLRERHYKQSSSSLPSDPLPK